MHSSLIIALNSFHLPQFLMRHFSLSKGLVAISQKELSTSVRVRGLRHSTLRVLSPHPHVAEHCIHTHVYVFMCMYIRAVCIYVLTLSFVVIKLHTYWTGENSSPNSIETSSATTTSKCCVIAMFNGRTNKTL